MRIIPIHESFFLCLDKSSKPGTSGGSSSPHAGGQGGSKVLFKHKPKKFKPRPYEGETFRITNPDDVSSISTPLCDNGVDRYHAEKIFVGNTSKNEKINLKIQKKTKIKADKNRHV